MADNSGIQQIFDAFQYMKVLVIGDVMLDNYIFGNIERISPEAPIPIVDVYKRESRLGGAANVAANIKELGATPLLVSVVGDDTEGHSFQRILQSYGIDKSNVILDQERKTTVKTRVISRNQHMLRYDYEQKELLDDKTELLLIDNVIDLLYNEKPNVVVFQDYNKGVLTPKIIANVIHNCQQLNIPVAVDPKKNNFFAYKGCTLFKPNLREAIDGLKMDINPSHPSSLQAAHQRLQELLEHQISVITLSNKGVYIGTLDDQELIPACYRNIVDVSGAGDTVISILALGLGLGLDVFASAELANIAAGLVCEQVGVSPINRKRLQQEALAFFAAAEESV